MSVGSWSPTPTPSEAAQLLRPELLARFIAFSKAEQLQQLSAVVSTEDQQLNTNIKLDANTWQQAAEHLSNDDIVHLMRFLTCAEMQFTGWEADEKSPVIHLHKLLKKRGEKLDREVLLWMRSQSSNRFIPNGAL